MSRVVRLRTELASYGGTKAGFVIPDTLVDELGGGGRPKVVVSVGDFTWRSSIARMGGQFLLGMSNERRQEAGVAAGDVLDLEISLDEAPRVVEVPPELAVALDADPAATAAWTSWSYTRQNEAARSIREAKRPETRASRLATVLTELRG